MITTWSDPDDRRLACSIFGTDYAVKAEGMLLSWMARHGFTQARLCSIELSVGAAVTFDLPSGSKVFVKVWPGRTDPGVLSAQAEVQRGMAARGFPAPIVLSNVSALGPGWALAMEYNRAGFPADARVAAVRNNMASGLVRFVTEAERYRDLNGLPRRSLPLEGTVWPEPHNALFDFQATARGAEWIDDIAGAALITMRSARSLIVVGHHDWSAKNMRMGPDGIAVVYDWDAVFLDREAFCLGSAAAHFPVTWELDVPETPTVAEVASFVREYQQARGAPLADFELAEVEAAATYARAYKARCEHAIDPGAARWGGSSRESLKINGAFHLERP